MAKNKTVTIDCAKWRRGGPEQFRTPYTSLLHTPVHSEPLLAGKMCCLGFAMLQLDAAITPDHIRGKSCPASTHCVVEPLTERNWEDRVIDTDFAEEAMTINDKTGIPDKIRMQLLRNLFGTKDITLRFRNLKGNLLEDQRT